MDRRILLITLALILGIMAIPNVYAVNLPVGTAFWQYANTISTGGAVSANTQVMYTMNVGALGPTIIGTNDMNGEAFNTISGALYNCWIESNAIATSNNLNVWCRIPEGGWTVNNNIAFGWLSTSTNNFNSVGHWGEAPTLSATYAQYDDGPLVFNGFYTNFLSSTETTGVGLACTGTCIISNGATVTPSGYLLTSQTYAPAGGNYLELQVYSPVQSTAGWQSGGYATAGSGAGQPSAGGVGYDPTGAAGRYLLTSTSTSNFNNVASSAPASANIIISLYWPSSASANMLWNYGSSVSFPTDVPSVAQPIGLWNDQGGGIPPNMIAYWMRIRIYPPSGISPTIVFGALQSAGATINLPASTGYGSSFNIVGTCIGTDTCNIYNTANGVLIATGTTTATYATGVLSVGAHTYNAVDSSSSTSSGTQTLTVTQGTPVITLPSFPSNQVYSSSPITITANIVSVNNQLTANVWVTNILITNFNTQTTFNVNGNVLGAYTVVANTLGNGNYLTATATNTFVIYVPFAAQNTIGISSITPVDTASSPFTWNTYYPAYLSVNSPSTTLNYSLTRQIGAAVTALTINAPGLGYLPPPNQVTGNYIYTVLERQSGNSNTISLVLAANTLNMQDFATLTEVANVIQYAPNLACASFTAIPSNWIIQSDIPGNAHSNSSSLWSATFGAGCGDQWSNANLTFMPMVTLTYPSPFNTFIANSINNPPITSITQNAFVFIANSLTPGNYLSRNTIFVSNFNQTSFNSLSAQDSISYQWAFNNYTGRITNLQYTANTFSIFIGASGFQNPQIKYSGINISASASNYEPTLNNFMPQNQVYSSPLLWKIYLPPVATSAGIVFNVYQCNNPASNFYLIINSAGTTGGTPSQVQSLYLSGSSPTTYLVATQLYQYQVISAANVIQYTSGLSAPSTPTTINLPCVTPIVPTILPNLVVVCNANYTSNTINCAGRDTNAQYDFLNEWKIVVYTTPTIVNQHILANTIIVANPSNQAKFIYTFNALNTSTQLWVSIYGIVPPYISLSNTSTSYLGYSGYFFGSIPGQITPGLAYNAILGILLFLVFLGVAYINDLVAAFGMPVVIIMGQFIGIFQFTVGFAYSIAIFMCAIGLILAWLRD